MVISHTWVPWAVEAPDGFPHPVTLNQAFSVESLPDSLQGFKRTNDMSADNLWLDIVCIPQGEDGALHEVDRAMRMREIARRAPIFRNADRAIAWLHDERDLSPLASMFELSILCTIGIKEKPRGLWISKMWHQMQRLLDSMQRKTTGLLGPVSETARREIGLSCPEKPANGYVDGLHRWTMNI